MHQLGYRIISRTCGRSASRPWWSLGQRGRLERARAPACVPGVVSVGRTTMRPGPRDLELGGLPLAAGPGEASCLRSRWGLLGREWHLDGGTARRRRLRADEAGVSECRRSEIVAGCGRRASRRRRPPGAYDPAARGRPRDRFPHVQLRLHRRPAGGLRALASGHARVVDPRPGGATLWGDPGDKPVPADYNGDGRSTWRSGVPPPASGGSPASATLGWGAAGRLPVPGDYDGDGNTDIAVWRPRPTSGRSEGHAPAALLGRPRRRRRPADYDGDGTTDIAVWRPSTGTGSCAAS